MAFHRRSFEPHVRAVFHRLRLNELPVLVFMAVLFGGSWAFIELADDVMENETASIDEAMLLAMRNPADLSDPLGPGWMEEMGRDFTALGGTAVLTLITLGVIGYLLLSGRHRVALFTALAIGGGIVASTLLKMGFDRPRPDLVPHEVIVYTASFPSGHSMLSAATYLTLAALLARVHTGRRIKAYLLAVAVFLTLLVGASRVYLGVHWPTDVLAGWSAGAAWAALCWLMARWLQQHGVVEDAPPS